MKKLSLAILIVVLLLVLPVLCFGQAMGGMGGGLGVTYDETAVVADVATLSNRVDALEVNYTKTVTISSAGADYTDIQVALNSNAVGGELFLVYPGTYTNTINFTADDQCVEGVGCAPKNQLVTQVDVGICDYGAWTGCTLNTIKLQVTSATSSVSTVEGTGSISIKDCHLKMVSSADFVNIGQPTCVKNTGTLVMRGGTVEYAHTGDCGGTARKNAIQSKAGSDFTFDDVDINVSNLGTAVWSSGVQSTAGGIVDTHFCRFEITDDGADDVYGQKFFTSSGEIEARRNSFHVTSVSDDATVLIADGTISIRSCYNHIHSVAASGTAMAANIGAGCTVISQLDDVVAANANIVNGTFTVVSSLSDGDWTVSGAVTAGEVNSTNATATNTFAGSLSITGTHASGNSAELAGGLAQIEDSTNRLTHVWWPASNRWAMVQIIGTGPAVTNVTFVSP